MTGEAEQSAWSRANAAADPTVVGAGDRLSRRALRRLLAPYLARQRQFNEAVLGTIVEVRDDLARQLAQVGDGDAAPGELAATRRQLDTVLASLTYQGDVIGALREVVDDQLLDRELVSQEIDLSRQQAFARFHDGLGQLRRELAELSRVLSSRADAAERRLGRAERALTEARLALGGREVVPGEATSGPELSSAEAPARVVTPAPRPSAAGAPGERFAALYASFEDEFRGPEGLIKERVAGYLADLEPLRGKGPVLDVGCGRGDLLEVLKEAGVEAYGVEVSTGYADRWKLAGLDVRVEDVAEHLAAVPAGSLAAVTALQVVEHLDTELLLGFLEQAHAALQPGGLLVLETPNPENVTVGAFTFWLDPTHERPIPAGLLAFLVRSQGFEDVEVRYLRRPELHGLAEVPVDAPWADDLAPVRDVVERLVFGAQDYAVLARRS